MKRKNLFSGLLFLILLIIPMVVFAEDAKIDTGDTTFIVLSTALVFIMTPALAFFYGGLVRKKNVLNTMMSSFIIIGLVSIQWVLFGYSLSFGKDINGLIGNFDFLGFKNVLSTPNADYAATIPHTAFAMFQLMFAIITVALITGSFAERMKFGAFVVFSLAWTTLVYDPLAHWVWGVGGWLRNLGALDFAGGTVVHISSGISGLVACLVLGKRNTNLKAVTPHNIPFVLLGASILWFGWFGFNAGSALAANGLALNAFVVTHTSAAAAMLSWVLIEWIKYKKPTILGAATGAVVGLVAITPAAGFVDPMAAIIIGFVVSPLCYFGVSVMKAKLGYDDSLDAFGCHGIGGIWGALATGIFASKEVNSLGNNGLLYGNPNQLWIQFVSVVATVAVAALATFVILKVIGLFTSLRVSEKEEALGLDLTVHGEEAYAE